MTVTWHCVGMVLCEVLIEMRISVQIYVTFIRNLIICTDFTRMTFIFHELMLIKLKITYVHVKK